MVISSDLKDASFQVQAMMVDKRFGQAGARIVLEECLVGREASFFGLYEISERGTSWMGPLLFGAVAAATNSYRQAMLSLIVLFVAGLVLLLLTDTDRAVRDASTA